MQIARRDMDAIQFFNVHINYNHNVSNYSEHGLTQLPWKSNAEVI
jgi:hypothetical protein